MKIHKACAKHHADGFKPGGLLGFLSSVLSSPHSPLRHLIPTLSRLPLVASLSRLSGSTKRNRLRVATKSERTVSLLAPPRNFVASFVDKAPDKDGGRRPLFTAHCSLITLFTLLLAAGTAYGQKATGGTSTNLALLRRCNQDKKRLKELIREGEGAERQGSR